MERIAEPIKRELPPLPVSFCTQAEGNKQLAASPRKR
jgi:hypothetical protein